MNVFPTHDWPTWRMLGLVAAAQVVTFAAGMYSGHTFWGKTELQPIQPNYIIAESKQPTGESPTVTNAEAPPNCPIKGNISGKTKIYHIQGGAFYERTQEEMCFQTEGEAQAAGFVKSTR